MNSLKQFQEEVEKEFDKKVNSEEWGAWKFVSDMLDNPDEYGIYPTSKCYEKIYDFVVEQKTLAYELGKKEMLEKLTPRIGMLRQWLNEERITDKKMVTSEDIKDWLGLSALNEE